MNRREREYLSFLESTPPFCPTPECYVHGMRWHYAEHHVPSCPAAGTYAAAAHNFSHAAQDVQAALTEALLPGLRAVQESLQEWYDALPFLTRCELRVRSWVWRRFHRG